MKRKTIPRGSYIFREGETGGYAYILNEGTVEIVKTTPEGPMVLSEVATGSLFGEMAVIDESPRSASARAKTDVAVTEVDRASFLKHISAKPETALGLMTRLATYVRATQRLTAESLLDSGGATLAEGGPKAPSDAAPIAETVEDTDAIYDRPVSRPVLAGGLAVLGLIGAALLFVSFTFVDTTVAARGKFTTKVPNVVVQATTNAVIRELLVERGREVAKGDVVVRLDGTYVAANLKVVSEKLAAVQRRIERLELEQRLLKSGGGVPRGGALDDVNRDILAKRLDEYRSTMASYRSRVSKLDQEIQAARNAVAIAAEQHDVKARIEGARKELFDKEIGSLLNYLTARDARLAADRDVANAANAVDRFTADRAAAVAEREAFDAKWVADLATQLAKEEELRVQLSEDKVKLQRQAADTDVRAPVDGTVLDLPTVAAGSIVREGEALITLVRSNVPVALEVDIDPKDVSDVRVGGPVSIKLDALPFQQFGDLPGVLVFVSNDTFEKSLSGEKGAYYRGRVEIADGGLGRLPSGFRLTPGMLATADLKVGERRLGTYFVNPIVKNLQRSFQEPD